jgi:hypothetical protein
MSSGLSRRKFLEFTGTLALGCFGMGICFPPSSAPRFFMDGGVIEINRTIKDLHLNRHEIIEFIPTVKILGCQTEARVGLNIPVHVVDNIYEFTFLPLKKYPVPESQAGRNDCHHYLISIFGMFKAFHFNFTRPFKSYLKINTRYSGYGAFSNTVKPWEFNDFISKTEVGEVMATGRIVSITSSMPHFCDKGPGLDRFRMRPYVADLNAVKRIVAKYKREDREFFSPAHKAFPYQPIYEISIV